MAGIEQQLEAQQALTRIIAEAPPTHEALPEILDAIGRAFGWEVGAVWQRGPGGELLCAHQWAVHGFDDFAALTARLRLDTATGLPGRTLRAAAPVWIGDVTVEPGFVRAEAAAAAGLRSAVAFPVVAGATPSAVIEFFTRALRAPDPVLTETLRALGRQVGTYLERRRAEDAVRESESMKSAILEAALDAIITMDHTGRVVDFNPAAERIFGYTREQAVGRELAELVIPPALRDAHRDGLARYLRSGEGPVLRRRLELPAITADGREIPVELTITPIEHGPAPIFAGHLRDLTDQVRAEETVRALSTPVLRIGRRLLLVPVVGAVDPARAASLREQLLSAVRESRARAVVIDVTGMPEFDQLVAEVIVATVTAVRLMGAEVLLTGISGALAASLVDLDVDLTGITALADLQAGIEQVLALGGD